MSSKLFIEKLIQIGYPGAENLDSCSIDFLFCNKKLAPFLHWICTNVNSENILRSSEISRYDAIEAAGTQVLNVKELAAINALPQLDDEETLEKLRHEVAKLERQSGDFDKQMKVQTLHMQNMSSNYDSLCAHINHLEFNICNTKSRLELMKTTCHNDNTAMNGTLDAIQDKLENVFERLEMLPDLKKGWISVVDLNPFCRSSENSIRDVVTVLRQRFAAKSLQTVACDERNREECHLVQKRLPNNKMGLFKEEVRRKGAESALAAAQSMALLTFCSTPEVLSLKLSEVNRAIETLNCENDSLMSSVSSQVIKEANMSSALIVSSECSSKLKRLQSSISIVDKMLSKLVGHLARVKFTSVAIETEKRYFQHVMDTVEDLEKLIRDESRSFDERKKFVNDLKCALAESEHVSTGTQLVAFDVANTSGLNNRTLSRDDEVAIAQQTLVELKEKDAALSETLELNFRLEKSFLRKMNCSLSLLREVIWSECATSNEVPTITPREILYSLEKVEKNFNVTQSNLFEAMADYRAKEKALRADSCLQFKRALYVYFYISPESLRRTVHIIRSKENDKTFEGN